MADNDDTQTTTEQSQDQLPPPAIDLFATIMSAVEEGSVDRVLADWRQYAVEGLRFTGDPAGASLLADAMVIEQLTRERRFENHFVMQRHAQAQAVAAQEAARIEEDRQRALKRESDAHAASLLAALTRPSPTIPPRVQPVSEDLALAPAAPAVPVSPSEETVAAPVAAAPTPATMPEPTEASA
jgi:hypothetical protein